MLKPRMHVIRRLLAGTVVAAAFAIAPQLAQAQAPGSLTQLGGLNNCVQIATESDECLSTGTGLNGTSDVAVSPDGKNVYVLGASDDAIAEFARKADGSLAQLDSPNDCIADTSADGTCPNDTATGLVDPKGIVVSPDGDNVYVVATDSHGIGTVAEFARNADGSLTQLSPNACIAENAGQEDGSVSDCANQTGHGIFTPSALAISHDGQNVYVADQGGEAVAEFTRTADGALAQLNGANDCITESGDDSSDCTSTAEGLTGAFDVGVSRDGANVYVASIGVDQQAMIAEFARGDSGSLTQLPSPNNCVEEDGSNQGCGTDVLGLDGQIGIALSSDGHNLYSASQFVGGPIAEFTRNADGSLTQLPAPNNCIEEVGGGEGCGSQGVGIASGFELQVSPDGANVYAAAPDVNCNTNCQDVAEFTRNPDGSLTQLARPDDCIQEHTAENLGNPECGNENGHGLGGPALAISPDGTSVYVAGFNDIAEFSRALVQHTLTVSFAGSGGGVVANQTGGTCTSTCSDTYQADQQVTLTASPDPGSTFTGWSGACSGTGPCELTMNADMSVTATFTAATTSTPPTPGAPTPVVTGAPTAVTDFAAGFTASVNPDGLPTTVSFQYGLDKRYTQLGGSGPNYTLQTPGQVIGSDFNTHDVGPVTVSGLVPNALYHVRVIATNNAGTTVGQDVTFMTKLAPLPGPPTLGQTFNIAPVSGLIFILVHGQLVPLTQLEQIGPNTTVDSRLGTLLLVTATGGGQGARDAAAKGKTQSGKFGGAVFRVHQALGKADRGLTTLMMVESAFKGAPSQAICKAPGRTSDASAAKLNSKVIQLLHASAHGKFSTSGRYSAATVRGTVWTIIARCDGTLVRDIRDSVLVRDFIRHKTIVLHAGQSYFSPGPGKR